MDRMPTAYSEIKVADPVRKQDKREAFTNDQLNLIFRSPVDEQQKRDSNLFWVSLIALWNGMRSNEICQLDVSEALLRKSVFERTSPFPGRTYATDSVTGMPRAE